MRTLWFAILLAGAACGGTKKAPATPDQGADEATERGDDTGARDENKPDDPDDMPSRGMDDPGDE